MILNQIRCPICDSKKNKEYSRYTTKTGEQRKLYNCDNCKFVFSETKNTPIANLKKPIFLIIRVLKSLNEGMGINAATRVFDVSKNSIYRWQERLSSLKETLLLFALTHQFFQQTIEGDELYTKVKKNVPPPDSPMAFT